VKKIILTGGGTAGHVTPNIALLPLLRKHDFQIHYIGTRSGIEDRLIVKEGIPFHAISAGKLRRYFDLQNFTDLFRIIAGFFQSLMLIYRLKPIVVFSKGGFVAVPAVWAAWLEKVPVIIHESDITPGLANQLSLPFAKKICYSFPESAKHLSRKKAVHTGLPIRKLLLTGDASEGKSICEFTEDKTVLMIMGGSQGSVKINRAVHEALDMLLPEFNIIHICGKGNLVKNKAGYRQFEYATDELPHLFAATDIFIGRSGATTLFELLALKKPSLLIPLPAGASRGDQILNAHSFEQLGIGVVLPQKDLTPDTLTAGIKKVYAKRASMMEAILRSDIPDGAKAVTEVILSVVKTHGMK
jgi:UDP-N-acetylglucosamine--N-acetylmuramyl-(pentapeptide) pyrophosphoryl-undecaprenol N-acetylglucosamine transferase